MENKDTFAYTYSAKEQTEIEAIRKRYLPDGEDKMETLRRLDRSASQKAQAWSIALGVIGALIMGTGMSLFMSDLGQKLGIHGNLSMVIGVAAGLLGMVLVALAYPLYNRILKQERRRIAPEILRLTEELMR